MRENLKNKAAIVYCAVHSESKKKYIGVTSKKLRMRMAGHKCYALAKRGKGYFPNAIRKHGIDAFNFYILNKFDTYAEALEEERRLIALVKPEYNSTMGGEGVLGLVWSEEARRKLKNVKFTESRKQNLREIGLKNKHIWEKYSHLGPKSFSRPVICLDDGKIFPSASAAGRHYGCAISALIELCLEKRNRKTVNGRRFKYVEEKK